MRAREKRERKRGENFTSQEKQGRGTGVTGARVLRVCSEVKDALPTYAQTFYGVLGHFPTNLKQVLVYITLMKVLFFMRIHLQS